jgi:hypothetical protein
MRAAKKNGRRRKRSAIVPWLMAMADSSETWREKRQRNPKRMGEFAQAAFLMRARTNGFGLAIPWGDSEKYDFVVWARRPGAKMLRVQVKSTMRLHRRGYEIQPVYTTRKQGKMRYTADEIDVLAAYVRPKDTWYLLPIGAFAPAKCLRFYPDIVSRNPRWEQYREGWEVLDVERD